MALLTSARTAQSPLVASFTFNFDDTMVPVGGGAAVDFGATNVAATTVMVIPLPPGSTVTGGSVDTSTAFTVGMAISVGDATVPTRYGSALAAGDAGSEALVPTGYLNVSGENVQITFDAVSAQSAGTCTVRVEYVVDGRACEVQVA